MYTHYLSAAENLNLNDLDAQVWIQTCVNTWLSLQVLCCFRDAANCNVTKKHAH